MSQSQTSSRQPCPKPSSTSRAGFAPRRHQDRGGRHCWLALGLLLVTLNVGCMQIDVRHNASSLASALQTEDVAGAIERMERRLAAAPHDKSLAHLRFQLAVLYAHHRNPAPNYLKAGDLLAEYLTLKPQQSNSDEVLYLQALLKQIERQEERAAELEHQITANQNVADHLTDTNHNLQDQLETLQQANQRLADENRHLELENQSMREMIEQLKRLDVHIEKKRQILDQF